MIHGLANGIAYVSLRRIRDVVGTEPAVFLIRSRGVDTTARRYDARTGPAERTVAQYATWRVTQINVPGGWNSITGLTKNGGSGTLSGVDACGVNAAIAGVSVPTLPRVVSRATPRAADRQLGARRVRHLSTTWAR